ncbi:MAG TPA: hypothetical protein VIJ12_02530 [Candidatus Baltobacteraceae bacterium]
MERPIDIRERENNRQHEERMIKDLPREQQEMMRAYFRRDDARHDYSKGLQIVPDYHPDDAKCAKMYAALNSADYARAARETREWHQQHAQDFASRRNAASEQEWDRQNAQFGGPTRYR